MDRVAAAYARISDVNDVPRNFGGLPREYSSRRGSRFVVIPAPYEESVSYGHGTKDGPSAIIDASRHMELFDAETKLSPFVEGIFTARPVKAKGTRKYLDQLRNRTADALSDGKIPVILGGEHTISLAPVEALAGSGASFGILHFDAHSDLRDDFDGSPYSHACVMRRCIELDAVRALSQVGIRSTSYFEQASLANPKVSTIYGHQLRDNWIEKALEPLPRDIYITFDVDAFDPSIMPATGTPEPGGMFWDDALSLLREAFRTRKVLGFDVVEFAPIKGLHHPQFTCAVLVHKMLCYELYFSRQ